MAQCLWFINTQRHHDRRARTHHFGDRKLEVRAIRLLLDHPPLGRKIMTAPLYFFTKADVDLLHWKAEDIPINFRPEYLKWVRCVVMLMGVLLACSVVGGRQNLFRFGGGVCSGAVLLQPPV